MITIVTATTKKQMRDFVYFPFTLYKNNPYWIPPLISDELQTFDPKLNPIFESASAHFYLAYQNGKLVGRIAAIINWDEVQNLGKKKMRFGWFDVIDDIAVTEALLAKITEIGKKNNLDHIEGPMGFSNLDKVGLLTEGFNEIGTMITWYNHPYYVQHLEKLGFLKEKEYIESYFSFSGVDPTPFQRGAEMVKKRYKLNAVNYTSTQEVINRVDELFDLFNAAYASLSSFVAVTEKQKAFFKNKYMGMINPEYIKFVEDESGKMVAFTIVMPSFTSALKKSNGRMFPFGFLHFLKAKIKNDEVVFFLIGIHPEYQNKGVTAIIFDEYYKSFTKNGVKTCIRTPELEENHAIHNLWKHFNPEIYKRRRTYTKPI